MQDTLPSSEEISEILGNVISMCCLFGAALHLLAFCISFNQSFTARNDLNLRLQQLPTTGGCDKLSYATVERQLIKS